MTDKSKRPPLLLDWIESELGALSPSFHAIGLFFLKNWSALQSMQIGEVASRCGTADSTVVRFARRFGYSGYPDLKMALLLESAATRLGARGGEFHGPTPVSPTRDTRTDALVGKVDEAVHRLNGLKAVIRSPEFLSLSKQLRHSACFTLTYGCEYDRLVAMYLGDALERAGKTVILMDRPFRRLLPRHEASGIRLAIHLELLVAEAGTTEQAALTPGALQPSLIGTSGLLMPRPSINPPVLWVAGHSLGHRAQIAMTLSDALAGSLA